MFGNFIRVLAKLIRSGGWFLQGMSEKLFRNADSSKLVQKGADRSLYRTRFNDLFWLNDTGYVDKCIRETGVFEPESTTVVNRLVKNGDVVLDVGANIGYYTVILSKLVGPQGKVLCFEPTEHFGKVLKKNLEINNVKNTELFALGLSNKEQVLDIQIGPSSASLHSPGKDEISHWESIKLVTLDGFLEKRPLERIDFIKIDVDGHEPLFLEGAWKSLDKYDPLILLEVSHPHYLQAGYTAWDFYDSLKQRQYNIYDETGLAEFKTKDEFLLKCANFTHSANIVITKRNLRPLIEDDQCPLI